MWPVISSYSGSTIQKNMKNKFILSCCAVFLFTALPSISEAAETNSKVSSNGSVKKKEVKSSSSKPWRTKGSYLQLDAIDTNTTAYNRFIYYGDNLDSKPRSSKDTAGVGLSYKYAFNFNGFFIAPAVFVEQNSFGSTAMNGRDGTLQARNRYGAKMDVGYDMGNYISPFVTGGYAIVQYRNTLRVYNDILVNDNSVRSHRSGSYSSPFIGGGIKINLSKSIALNLEYNYQKLEAKAEVPPQVTDYIGGSKYMTRLDIFKMGLSYNF